MKVKFDGNHSLVITIEEDKGEDKSLATKALNDVNWIELFRNMEDKDRPFSTHWTEYVQDNDFLEAIEYHLHLKEFEHIFD